MVIAFVGGLLIERVVIRPVEDAPILTIVIVTLGLLVIFNSVAGWIYSYIQKPFPSPFPAKPIKVGNIVFGAHDLGAIGVTLVVLLLLFLFFRYTTLGLAMRAAAQNPVSSRLVRHPRELDARRSGWGLAAAFGAVAGMMVAPVVFLDPNMMGGIQIYAFAAATVGGFTSPLGAVVGGFLVGVTENLVGTYVSLHRHRAQAHGGAGHDHHRAARQAERPLRPHHRAPGLVERPSHGSAGGHRRAAGDPGGGGLRSPFFVSGFRLFQFTQVLHLRHRAPRPQHADRLQRPVLARATAPSTRSGPTPPPS